MELSDWEIKELEKIRHSKDNLYDLYYQNVDSKEKKDILDQILSQASDNEETNEIMKEFYHNRYSVRRRGESDIDYMIRGWVNIAFLPQMNKSIFSRKKVPGKIQEILKDLGKDIADKHGELGYELWYKELCNSARVYIHLCKKDKTYGSVMFGIGHMRDEKLIKKIAFDVVNITHTIPSELKTGEFELLEKAAKEVFVQVFPKEERLYKLTLDRADGKAVRIDD